MAQEVAPVEAKVTISVVTSTMITGGIALGPILSALANYLSGAESVFQRSVYPMVLVAVLHLLLGVAALRLPKSLLAAFAAKGGGEADEAKKKDKERQANTDDSMFFWIAALAYEHTRAFIVSSVESVTSLMLEVDYGMQLCFF